MSAGSRLIAGLVFLLGELHASGHSMICKGIVTCNVLRARRAQRTRHISEEKNAHIIGLTVTRLDGSMHKSHVSQYGMHAKVRQGAQHVCRSVYPCEEAEMKAAKSGKTFWRTLEAAGKSWHHATSKLTRRCRSDCDVLASEAERCGQPSSFRGNIVQSPRVAQKDTPGHTEEKHAVHYDGPQRSDGHSWRR